MHLETLGIRCRTLLDETDPFVWPCTFTRQHRNSMVLEERKLVWKGTIPLQLQLHNSEVTTVPPPLSCLILASRNGYLPILIPAVKPQFQSALPIGQDTGWFEYEGLPLKWHIPIGVLFDLLCFEPERPWNLMVHFRGYPSELLPYEGEDAMKWNFINSLKEASYAMYGSTKHVMNLSQPDQSDLWRSVLQGDLDSYDHVCSRLPPTSAKSKTPGDIRTIRMEDGDGTSVKSWEDITYISRPVEVWSEDVGGVLTLWEALQKIAPQLFVCASEVTSRDPSLPSPLIWVNKFLCEGTADADYEKIRMMYPHLRGQQAHYANGTIRIQGIEPSPDLPIDWVAQNLCGPDHFIHACILIVSDEKKNESV